MKTPHTGTLQTAVPTQRNQEGPARRYAFHTPCPTTDAIHSPRAYSPAASEGTQTEIHACLELTLRGEVRVFLKISELWSKSERGPIHEKRKRKGERRQQGEEQQRKGLRGHGAAAPGGP